jgi:general nucleoside transport system permease protein
MMRSAGRSDVVWRGVALGVAMLGATLVLLAAGAPPLATFGNIVRGALGSPRNVTEVLTAWVPLLLATAGVLVTFAAGLWNIGIEGQITLGAIFSTGALRLLSDSGWPSPVILGLAILAGLLGGALWAALAGALKVFGGVSEIFGGLGLNFVATALAIWLIFGPWQRPGTGSMSGTQPFPDALWLPALRGGHLSPWALLLGVLALGLVLVLIQDSIFGLKLKAVGKNARAARLLGVPTWRTMMAAFALCGALAGAAGAIQVTAVYHRLIPSISSGYGYLALLVGMLVGSRVLWAASVALFFAALNIGSIQLPIVLKLDSSLAGVLQGMLVLAVLMIQGLRQRLAGQR